MRNNLENEGLLWVAQQLAWERRFEQLTQNFNGESETGTEPARRDSVPASLW